ncbi:hypothetical protein [Pseudomonas sp. WMBT8]|uniref:hypothetical protein n=1 Tax=Pseudomonas sp. WMBT8 TaxID=3414496 RepID=UPI003D803751
MDDYGFVAVNDHGSVSISSVYKVLVFSERGQFRIQSRYTDKEGKGQFTFAKPIRTVEPPQIFLRTISASHASLGLYTSIEGSSGNWTGFHVTSAVRGGSVLQDYLMEFVSCKYSDQGSSSEYGLEVRDAQNRIMFVSSDRVVRYGKFSKSWTVGRGRFVDIYYSDLTVDADDFISVSSLDRGIMWFANDSKYAGITILEGGVPVLQIFNQRHYLERFYWQGSDGFCLSIPVCKFPIERYYN